MSARGHLERTPVTSRDGRAANNGPGGGNTVRTVDAPWVELLLALHCQVRNALAKAGRGSTGATNPKGDEVKVFDLAANDAAVACLKAAAVPLIVQSEEAEPLEIGRDRPRYRLILDPVDGSDNRARGLPLSALSCAVLPVDAPLHPDWVEAALVGPLEEETRLIALRGSGAWRGNDRLESSDVRGIAEAMISVELNHFFSPPGFARMMAAAKGGAVLRLRVPSPLPGCRWCHRRPCGGASPSDGGKLSRCRAAGDRGGGMDWRPRRHAPGGGRRFDRPHLLDRGGEPGSVRRNRGGLGR